MKKFHSAAIVIALGSLAALPGCSQLGMHMPGSQTSSTEPAAAPAPMANSEISPGMVKQVQTTLQQQGLYKGNIDGVWGAATVGAVQTYQQKHNLIANGQLDEPTLKSLNMTNNTANNSSAPNNAPPAPPAPPAAQSPAVSSGPNNTPPAPPAATNQ